METLSVSQFIALINETLGFTYPSVVIEGEVSSFQINKGKFVFFDLKDKESTLNCFMMVYQLQTPLEDGMKVRITAQPKVTKWGRFSVTVRGIELAGEGELRRAYELLKEQLEKEGLFDAARKRRLPRFPKTIGVISSAQAAGYSDFLKILHQRWSGVEIRLADVAVQGAMAPEQIVAAINYFNQLAQPVDVLVIVRGGGSLEDLQAFNTEPVTRAIAGSRTPTIVGVGHEVDTSLADLAADVRAATPTDAARLVVPDRTEISAYINHQQQLAENSLWRQVNSYQAEIRHYSLNLERFLSLPKTRIDNLTLRLGQRFSRCTDQVATRQVFLNQLEHALIISQQALTRSKLQQLKGMRRNLENLSPQRVLKRGYAIARIGKRLVRSAADVAVGEKLMLQLTESEIITEVKDVKKL